MLTLQRYLKEIKLKFLQIPSEDIIIQFYMTFNDDEDEYNVYDDNYIARAKIYSSALDCGCREESINNFFKLMQSLIPEPINNELISSHYHIATSHMRCQYLIEDMHELSEEDAQFIKNLVNLIEMGYSEDLLKYFINKALLFDCCDPIETNRFRSQLDAVIRYYPTDVKSDFIIYLCDFPINGNVLQYSKPFYNFRVPPNFVYFIMINASLPALDKLIISCQLLNNVELVLLFITKVIGEHACNDICCINKIFHEMVSKYK